MDEFFRPILLTSLIIGMVVLIFLEKRKGGRQKMEEATQNAGDITKEITKDIEKEEEEVQECISTLSTPLQASSTTSTHFSTSSTHSSTSSSSSGSEEEATRPRKVLKRPKKKQCKGSPTICATKRKVTDVTVVTDSLEEKVQVCVCVCVLKVVTSVSL
ncbi:hypothetical protein E2C01_028424 [Portunus trituberculatus]|uniref:Uncharacterized protein n=1 Tax=Portunus trituberculatus TaxID=210409 RepID=A0A5B7EP08_PORTR|nr:hypothetical protein [Portunus trituberculatus]